MFNSGEDGTCRHAVGAITLVEYSVLPIGAIYPHPSRLWTAGPAIAPNSALGGVPRQTLSALLNPQLAADRLGPRNRRYAI